MAKRKDLLLNESTVSRMMGLAGIGALTNPFLKEELQGGDYNDYADGDKEEEMEEGYDSMEELEEGEEELDEGYEDLEEELDEGYEDLEEGYDSMEELEEGEEEDLEEAKERCSKCGKIHEGSSCGSGYMQESVRNSMKRLKKLLEQAEVGSEPPAPEGGEEMPPEPAPGGAGDDQMEAKIKEFVKKLGELVQETLGVQVTVEEGEGEPEMPEGEMGAAPAPAAGGAEAPAPMAEAINRLVNKVAHRVKARLMEAKKDPKVAAAKAKKMKMMKEKQMAAKKKEKEEAAKKKEMEMKKKKAAIAKKK